MGRSKNSGLGFGIGRGSQGSIMQGNVNNKIDSLSKTTKPEVCYEKVSNSSNTLCVYDTLKNNGKNVEKSHEIHKKHPFSKPQNSPIHVPKNAKMKVENKKGYEQVKYTWKHGNYSYEARWHTKTKDAPVNGQSWVVKRQRKGIGYGPNARKNETHFLSGSKWVSKKDWFDAIKARKAGTATKKQIEMLDKGHYRKGSK